MQALDGLQYDVRGARDRRLLDPNTFLACWITATATTAAAGATGATTASSTRPREMDAHRRFAILREAEALLLAEGRRCRVSLLHERAGEALRAGIYQTRSTFTRSPRVDRPRLAEQRAPAAMAEPGPR